MSTAGTTGTTVDTPQASAAAGGRVARRPRRAIDWGKYFTWAVMAWLFAPIAFMIAFSFNDVHGRHNVAWQGFTLRWYADAFAYPDLTTALLTSLAIALLTMVIAGVLGSLLGLALGRYRFRGQGASNLVMFAAISAPEVVLGAALLSLFLTMNVATGFLTILLAHVMFTVSFVAITVRARVLTLDPSLEEASRDLGATPLTTFRLVTLPLLAPAIMAGGLIAFALSIDDYIITSFVSGNTTTFPLWIWGSTRVGIPPQVNVMGTLIFAVGVALAIVNIVLARRRA
ncbi:spermidine/putrescine transport system permease protein [Nocardiopsis mwathae]|uniref:Spermidine/putrescine transport system permease protein n=1 Tax=Nocardiopsis mwathae TaxID=1472723 RepID=A0A7W9YKG3_9ACTN|nr:ABC transporter permease [Nocardiopsis mwathae]MBB6173692.1 spermidine/putrescine transport system permease protein [Nocardiopsis mwathae]